MPVAQPFEDLGEALRKAVVWPLFSVLLVMAFAIASPSAGLLAEEARPDGPVEGKASSIRVSTIAGGLTLPWGMAFLPNGDALVGERDTGRLLRRLFATEFGQNTYDEVNRVRAGKNYGWPVVEGRENNPNYANPVAVFSPADASPSGAAIPRRLKVRDWNGDFFMATLRGQSLYRLELDGRGRVKYRARLLQGDYGRLRHVAPAPDGTLWVLTSNGQNDRVLRVTK